MMERTVERVSVFNASEDFSVLNRTEEVLTGARLLQKFFWVFTAHGDPEDHQLYLTEFASFYSVRLPRSVELQERGFDIAKVEMSIDIVPQVFFDQRDISFDFTNIPPQKVVCLFLNGKQIGIYFVASRVLVATDWTHNLKCIETLKRLLPTLSKIFRRRSVRPPKPRIEIKFGADPEFELVSLQTCKVVSADRVIDGGTSSSHQIGVDGAGSQVEIRPAPSSNIEEFIRNFRDILKRFAREYPGYTLSAQGDVHPLGGHIHLSVKPDSRIIALLDHWIGEQVIDLSGAARGSYKKMGATERKPWGFEYRTPPAAIFMSPRILRAVLRVIKKVVSNYYKRDGVLLYPDADEIRRLGIEKDWGVLQDFISQYPALDKDVMRGWRIKVSQVNKIDLVFRDDWNDQVMSYVKELFFKKLDKRMMKKLNKRGINKLLFFGLKKERGDVCNFPTSLFSTVDYKYSIDDGLAFGFPWCVRMPEELRDELKEMWCILVDDVVRELRNKVK